MSATSTSVTGVARFERFFRLAASLDVDKEDLRRHHEFISRKLVDLLIRGEAVAKANGRDIIEASDLPITKGLQETIHAFKKIDEDTGVKPLLERLVALPPLDLACSEETEARLPDVAGGLSVALARSFTIIDPDLKNPSSQHWDRSFRIFDLLL
jgi:hypothetical protein